MDELSLFDYLHVLRRRRWSVAVVTIAVVVIAAILLAITPKTYEGSATLLFPQQTEDTLGSQLAQLAGIPMVFGGLPSLSGRDVYISVLKSRTISENVCKRLDLEKLGLEYEDLQDRVKLDTPKEGGLVITCQAPTSWLKGRVQSDMLAERTAELSAEITNAYVCELQVYDQAHALFMGKKNRLYIEEQIRRTKGELRVAEYRLTRFQKAHPTLIPPDKASSYAAQALELFSRQTEADVALNEMQGQVTTARAVWQAGAPGDVSPEAVMDSPVLSNLRAKLAELEVERATLLENFTGKHPDVVSLDQEIEKVSQEIRSEVDRIVSGRAGSESPAHQEVLRQLVVLEIGRDGLEARKSALASAMANIEGRLAKLPPMEMEYAGLLRDLKAAETVYTTLLAEHAKARVAEGRETESFVVLDEAIAPELPAKPRVKLLLAASLLLGLCGGALAALVQESFAGMASMSAKARGRRKPPE